MNTKIKIVDWVNGYDDLTDHKTNSNHFKNYTKLLQENNITCDEVRDIIINDIIKNKYYFDGNYHQYGDYGTPVIEINGKKTLFFASMRYWGNMMADAWNVIEKDKNSHYDYIDFYMGCSKDPKFKVFKKY